MSNPATATTGAFDAAAIAEEAMDRGEDALGAVIGQLIGYSSTLWENLSGTGIFQSTEAQQALVSTVAWLRDQGA